MKRLLFLILIALTVGCKKPPVQEISFDPQPVPTQVVALRRDAVPDYSIKKSDFKFPVNGFLINGERWGLTSVSFTDRNIEGFTDCADRDILFEYDIKTAQEQRTVLWHEMFHASRCNLRDDSDSNWAGAVTNDPEHEQVYLTGMFMASFAHDNPEFIEWAKDWK